MHRTAIRGRRVLAVLAVVIAALTTLAVAVEATPGVRETAPVTWHPQTGMGGEPAGTSASLVRKPNGVLNYRLGSAGLEPGNVYTLWFVVVDDPSGCATSPCSASDIFTDPAVDGQVTYAAGAIASGAGTAVFTGSQRTGVIDGWNGPRSFDDAIGAEIHLVVNDHGPRVPGMLDSMLHSYRGGCSDDSPFPEVFPQVALDDGVPGPNTCLLTQVAIFQA